MNLLQRERPEIVTQSDPPPVDLSVANIQWHCGLMVRDSAMVTTGSVQETTIALSSGTIDDALRPPLPSKWRPKCTSRHSLVICRISNGHISAMGRPIHFMFSSRIGFSGSVDRMAPFLVRSNSRWRPVAILEYSEYLHHR